MRTRVDKRICKIFIAFNILLHRYQMGYILQPVKLTERSTGNKATQRVIYTKCCLSCLTFERVDHLVNGFTAESKRRCFHIEITVIRVLLFAGISLAKQLF